MGVALLLLSLWGVNWRQLLESLTSADLAWLLAVIASMAFSLLLKVARWIILLKKYGVMLPVRRVFEAFFAGQAANILLPTRGGEVVRLGIASAQDPARLPRVTATIALEKFLDLVALCIVSLGVAAYLPPERVLWVRQWLLPLSSLAILGLILIILLGPALWEKVNARISQNAHPWILRGADLMSKFVKSSLWLRKLSHTLPVLVITISIWGVMWLTNILLFQALDLELPFIAAGLVLVLGYIGVLPALMPGNIGPFYFFAQLAIRPFGVSSENSLAFAILLHAVVTLPPLIISGLFMLFSRSSFRQLDEEDVEKSPCPSPTLTETEQT